MVDKPSKPSGIWALKVDEDDNPIYFAENNSSVQVMSDAEYLQGRNMTGEPETLLGSIPDIHKEDWILQYFTHHLVYIEQMLDYLDEQISGGA